MSIMSQILGGNGKDGGRISAIHVWENVIKSLLSKNMSMRGPVRDHNFYASSNAIYSGRDNVTYLYTIDGYPNSVPVNLKAELRATARGNVRISFISPFEATYIPWDSAQMRSKLSTWQSSKENSDEVDEFNYRKKLKKMDSQNWRSETLIYLSDADQRRNRKLFKYRTMMLISGTRGELFDEVIEDTLKHAAGLSIQLTRVDDSIEQYLKAFSPFSMNMTDKVKKDVGNNTLTDEVMARLNTYSQGKVGSGDTYMGTDIDSDFAVFKQFKRDSVDAENMLISAETGGGKSYFVKCLLIQLLGSPLYNGTVMDIEGDEYTPIANFMMSDDEPGQDPSVVVLNMAEGVGHYFDPTEIIRVDDPDLDADMYSLSKSCTSSIFRSLIGKVPENLGTWVGDIVNQIVSRAYMQRGVSDDPETWKRTKGMTMFEIYDRFMDYYKEVKSKDEVSEYSDDSNFTSTINLVHSRLSSYFSTNGVNAHVFKKRVGLSDINKAKLVICSFGMRGKSSATVDPVQMSLSQIYAAHISHLRSMFSKSRGRYNFKVWEEFQRWGQFPGSFETINTALTGGRKLGDVNIIATNKLSELLGDDLFGVLDNTTSFALGAIGSARVRESICRILSIENMYDDLSRIVLPKNNKKRNELSEDDGSDIGDISESAQNTSKYYRAFLVYLDKVDVTMVKMQLSSAIEQSKLLRTGVDLNKNTDNDELLAQQGTANEIW